MIEKVALSGLNATDNPAPGYPIAKSLKGKYGLVGFSYDPNEPADYFDDLFEKVYLMPYPSLGFEELRRRLLRLKKESGIDLVIPNLDAELPLYITYREEIRNLGIETFLPEMEQFELRNKSRLASLSEKLGLRYPKTREVSSVDELIGAMEKFSFPLMIKGNYYKAYKVHNPESAIDAFHKISSEWGFPILVQETVEGEEINLVGLGDGEGRLIGAVSIKKLTTTSLGKIWTGITIHHEKLMETAENFVAKTGWRGPFELECMAAGDSLHLIEINPRFPAWIYFATAVGVNLPDMMVRLVSDEKVTPITDFPERKMYVRYTEEMVTDFSEFSKLITTKER
ncbi:ATP-grasp domain-containing protein [Hydrogenimonas sp.]